MSEEQLFVLLSVFVRAARRKGMGERAVSPTKRDLAKASGCSLQVLNPGFPRSPEQRDRIVKVGLALLGLAAGDPRLSEKLRALATTCQRMCRGCGAAFKGPFTRCEPCRLPAVAQWKKDVAVLIKTAPKLLGRGYRGASRRPGAVTYVKMGRIVGMTGEAFRHVWEAAGLPLRPAGGRPKQKPPSRPAPPTPPPLPRARPQTGRGVRKSGKAALAGCQSCVGAGV